MYGMLCSMYNPCQHNQQQSWLILRFNYKRTMRKSVGALYPVAKLNHANMLAFSRVKNNQVNVSTFKQESRQSMFRLLPWQAVKPWKIYVSIASLISAKIMHASNQCESTAAHYLICCRTRAAVLNNMKAVSSRLSRRFR